MKLKEFVINDGNIHPSIIICPGGGYNHLSNHEGDNVAERLNSFGISCFVLEYDFTFPAPLYDVKRAMRLVRYNADKYSIDPNRIGIMGFSAGGHLAGMCSEFFDDFEKEPVDGIDKISAKPDITVLCYSVITLSKDYGHVGSRIMLGEHTELAEKLSLENSVRSDMSPVFIWHTFEDKSVPYINSIEMAKALKNVNVPCELHIFPNGRHGSDLADNIPGTCQWSSLLVDFLKRHNFL